MMPVSNSVYADIIRPSQRSRALLYDAGLVIGGSILLALSARVAIPLPFSPVPITGQTLVVLLLGALLGSRRGVAAVGAYLMQGFAGLPVFTHGGFGLAYAMGPTGGYLLGFIAGAWLTGALAERGWDRKSAAAALAMVAGNAAIYIFGVAWLAVLLGWQKAVMVGAAPFVLGDIVKIGLAASLLPLGWKFVGAAKSKEDGL